MFHVVWILCWFIAAVEWAVAQNILKGVMVSIVEDQLNDNCTTPYNSTTFETSGYVQAAIGDVSYDCSNDIFTHLKYVFYHNLYTISPYWSDTQTIPRKGLVTVCFIPVETWRAGLSAEIIINHKDRACRVARNKTTSTGLEAHTIKLLVDGGLPHINFAKQ